MRVEVKYLEPDPDTGVLRYRRVYPLKLRRFIPGNPSQLKRSIGSRNISEPRAMVRFEHLAAEYARIVKAA
ncbi:MAG: hypothetical protein JWM75_26, partial [Sphingomonas bacterium]|nr:hypothetical protein [Sphingomonas bacterium]